MSEQSTAYSYTNRLINETSPYLLQHAHNPVDWYPWGEEAFEVARTLDRPVMLSIGYSACHWCHVMERESFENEEIAAFLNAHFVAIKVDREERPDLDAIYMQAVQAMTGQGGWPLTVFLTPDGRPFYGGTYFPPTDRRYGQQVMRGLPAILQIVLQAFTTHRADIDQQANGVAEHIRQSSQLVSSVVARLGSATPSMELLWKAVHELGKSYDKDHGGFARAPKFPSTMALEFLLRMDVHSLRGMPDPAPADDTVPVRTMVEQTLTQMARGGIYDQLGGGFHRYSVDDHWLVPHFEKMLYDNALLSRLYLHAYLETGNAFYRRVTEETLDYVIREMTDSLGGFYSTQDADSEGEEGKFFLWTPEEISAILPLDDAAMFMKYYDVTAQGNFEGKNILHVSRDDAAFAQDVMMDEDAVRESLARSRAALFNAREQRVRPARDEKVVTSWNALMMRSFAEAGRYLDRPDYLAVAEKNAHFLLNAVRDTTSDRLFHVWKDGVAHVPAMLEDYAFTADALLALFEASFDVHWFEAARHLMDQAIELFADAQQGGFFDTSIDHEQLISRPKEIMDNAIPSGNNVADAVLLRLAAFTGVDEYRERAEAYILPLTSLLVQYPSGLAVALGVLDTHLSGIREIALVGDPHQSDMQDLLRVVNARYLPDAVLAVADTSLPEATATVVAQTVALLEHRPMQQGKATAYVCQNFVCRAPVTDAMALAGLL